MFLKNGYKNFSEKNFFEDKNISKIHYFNGPSMTTDLLDFKILTSKYPSKKLLDLRNKYLYKEVPIFPIKAKKLIKDYNFKEGKELGEKLKILENIWLDNNFSISEDQIEKTLSS